MQLKDRLAVITGGGRGIGRAIALAFAEEGADVVVTARTNVEIEEVAKEVASFGRRGLAICADLNQKKSIDSMLEQVTSQFPAVHILVNNAGIGSGQNAKQIMEFDDEFWEMTLRVNLTAPYLIIKAILPKMIAQGWGRIINVSSVAGKMGYVYGSAYCASKHGLIGLTRTAAAEVAGKGVTVNAICPGPIRTAMLEKRIQFSSEQLGIPVEDVEKSFNPIQRLLEPEDVAGLAVYLASEKARDLTGQSLNICGGAVMS